jgi:hypothetical protein
MSGKKVLATMRGADETKEIGNRVGTAREISLRIALCRDQGIRESGIRDQASASSHRL